MKIDIKIILAIIAVSTLSVLGVFSLIRPVDVALGENAFQSTMFNVASTSKSVAVTSDSRILASTTSGTTRVYAAICNTSSVVPVYLKMDQDKSLTNSDGVFVATSTCYEITDRNLYQGAIHASSTNQTSATITVVSYEL